MAGTQYNTLNLVAEEVPAPKESHKLRKTVVVAAVVVAASVMFFAGRVYQGNATPFSHEEVLNIAETCEEGQFIGNCVTCSSCESYEYENGGCSFFKDTYCSYCESIPNCERESITCETRYDQKCETCDCDDPIVAWGSITKEDAVHGNPGNDALYSCYYSRTNEVGDVTSQVCTPCSVCPRGSYQTKACDPETHEDTECAPCKACGEDEYVKTACTYQSDTVCEPCKVCDAGFGTGQTLETLCSGVAYDEETNEKLNMNDLFVAGTDTQCKACSSCSDAEDKREFVQDVCKSATDTVCESCTECDDGQFISRECETSDGEFTLTTANAECAPCNEPAENFYITRLCDKTGYLVDFDGEECAVCEPNQYTAEPCKHGSATELGDNTNCVNCEQLVNCAFHNLRCDSGAGSTCTGCELNAYGNCCDNGALGESCRWEKMEAGCDTSGRSYRERQAARGGFDYETKSNADFVLWCKDNCDAFETCTAFEVDDCMFGETKCVTAESICGLKDTKVTGDGSDLKRCFVKP